MSYDTEHNKWLHHHISSRKGERLDALKRGHGYGNRWFVENIWWKLTGHFIGLHPEYEVTDLRGKSYFVDFMWIAGLIRIVFEIVDYGSHGVDRTKFRRDLNRTLFLQSQGCLVFSISLDEMKENPDFILSLLRSILAPYLMSLNGSTGNAERMLNKTEREIVRLAIIHNRMVRPTEAARELELHKITVIKHCRKLVDKGRLRAIPSEKSGIVTSYEYIGAIPSPDLV